MGPPSSIPLPIPAPNLVMIHKIVMSVAIAIAGLVMRLLLTPLTLLALHTLFIVHSVLAGIGKDPQIRDRLRCSRASSVFV